MRAAATLLAASLAACTGPSGTTDIGVPPPVTDAAVYNSCSTLCYRPGDCALAYPDDDRCPANFLCASRFTCVTDGSTD
jgi:hypothetical protein